jgi:hypothetical protein
MSSFDHNFPDDHNFPMTDHNFFHYDDVFQMLFLALIFVSCPLNAEVDVHLPAVQGVLSAVLMSETRVDNLGPC